ncbi:MAG: hypothetical protein JW768_14270 [Chitinispirillaceae bacterium]|nr:hypothetical protein [Chitinispirillaceae bacterium]
MPGLFLPSELLHYAAAGLSVALGIAYCVQAAAVVRDFKLVLAAHQRILIMSLVSQGILYFFIGTLVMLVRLLTPHSSFCRVLSFACAGMLLVLSVWTGSTGGRSEFLLFKTSHFVTIIAAGCLLLGCAQE